MCRAIERPPAAKNVKLDFDAPPSEAAFFPSLGDNELLLNPLLKDYWPSERRAIVAFHLHIRQKSDAEMDITTSITLWESGGGFPWRREKMRVDGQRQLKEIEIHKYFLSQEKGFDVGWDFAALDWIQTHAAKWRIWWENQPESSPRSPTPRF